MIGSHPGQRQIIETDGGGGGVADLVGPGGMRQHHASLLPLAALVSAGRPKDLSPLGLCPQLDVQRPGVLAEQVVPEGHAQVAVRRRDGQAGQPRHLLAVLLLAGLPDRIALAELHVHEVPPPACRGQQRIRQQLLGDYLASISCFQSNKTTINVETP